MSHHNRNLGMVNRMKQEEACVSYDTDFCRKTEEEEGNTELF